MAAIPVEYASQRKIRERNKLYYRFNHWPIWIFVFFIAPGPLVRTVLRRDMPKTLANLRAACEGRAGVLGEEGTGAGVGAAGR